MAGSTPLVRSAAVFSKKYPVSATVTVWASWKSRMPGVPSVNVRVDAMRLGLLASPLNHWMAPATLVSVIPFWVPASSRVRYRRMSRSFGPILAAAVCIARSSRQVGGPP